MRILIWCMNGVKNGNELNSEKFYVIEMDENSLRPHGKYTLGDKRKDNSQ